VCFGALREVVFADLRVAVALTMRIAPYIDELDFSRAIASTDAFLIQFKIHFLYSDCRPPLQHVREVGGEKRTLHQFN
jgi:hypothetical protein